MYPDFLAAFATISEPNALTLPSAGVCAVFAGVVALGIYFATAGIGILRKCQRIPDPAVAPAAIDRLFREGNWFSGSCFATVSFADLAGLRRQTTIGVAGKAWQFLREGGKVHVTYSKRNPEAALIGRTMGLYTFSGWGFLAAGSAIVVLVAYEFLSCSLGWGGSFWAK
jgi:hypothetical protein